jgi:hypothetical protein
MEDVLGRRRYARRDGVDAPPGYRNGFGKPCQRPPKQSHPGSPIESQCGEGTGLLGVS